MLIFKDLITDDELFTDANPIELIDDCLYEVKCSYISRKQGDFVLEGANPSAEGEDADEGGCDPTTESGLDLILNQKLQPTSFSKKDYMNYLKTYSKSLQEKWKDMGLSDDDMAEHKEKFSQAAKLVMKKLSDGVEFYVGESCNPDGMVAVLEYRPLPDGKEDPVMMFFKHGLERMKV